MIKLDTVISMIKIWDALAHKMKEFLWDKRYKIKIEVNWRIDGFWYNFVGEKFDNKIKNAVIEIKIVYIKY